MNSVGNGISLYYSGDDDLNTISAFSRPCPRTGEAEHAKKRAVTPSFVPFQKQKYLKNKNINMTIAARVGGRQDLGVTDARKEAKP